MYDYLYWLTGSAIAILLWTVIGLKANRADWDFWLTNSIDGWIRIFCRYYHRLDGDTIILPEKGGAIVVANHISGLDPFLLIASCRRPLHFLIAKEE